MFWQRTCVSVTHTREKERIGGIFYPIHCSKVNRCRPSQDRPRRAGRRLAFLVRSLFALLRFVERLSGHQPKSNKLIMDVHISAEACILWENLQMNSVEIEERKRFTPKFSLVRVGSESPNLFAFWLRPVSTVDKSPWGKKRGSGR